jgi:hypothetical protein
MTMDIEYGGETVEVEVEKDSYTPGEEPILFGPADNWYPGSSSEVEFRVLLDDEDITDELSGKQLEMIEEKLIEYLESDAADRRGEAMIEREEDRERERERYG